MLAIACPAQEPSPPIAGNTVIVTGTRLPAPAAVMASEVTVITRADIETRHASSAVELLRDIPGVVIEQAGSRGSVASLFIRGAKPNFTVVMIDGVKMNDETNTRGGSFDFSTLSLDLIERIEIIRGPESAIYGALAAGGVINIITRRGSEKPIADLEVSGGQFGYWGAGAEAGGTLGSVPATVALSHIDNGSPVDGSTYRGTLVGGSTSASLSDRWSFELTARYGSNHATSFPDDSGGPLLAVIRSLDRRDIDEAVLGARVQDQWSSRWSQSLEYGLYNRTSQETSPGVARSEQDPFGIPPSFDDIHYRRQEINWTQLLALGTGFHAAVGVDWQVEEGIDTGYLKYGELTLPSSYVLRRELMGAYVEARWPVLKDWELSAADRYDSPFDAASRLSPQLSSVYTIGTGDLKVRLSWGEGYKLPSFYALGNPIVGNPNLKPEMSRSEDVGISKSFAPLQLELRLDAFKSVFSNLIDFNPGPIPRLVNLAAVSVHGGEASAVLHADQRWTFEVNVSNTVTKDETTGASLLDIPRWLAGGHVLWHPAIRTDVDLRIFQVGSYIDNAVPTGDVRLSGHQRCDLAVTQSLSTHLRLYLAVENLFNRRYEEAVGFPATTLFTRIGLRWVR